MGSEFIARLQLQPGVFIRGDRAAAGSGRDTGRFAVSVKYSLLFLLLTGALLYSAFDHKGPAGTLLYIGLSIPFLLLAIAYAGLGPRVFIKRPDGRLHPLSWLLFAPYHLIKGVVVRVVGWIGGFDAYAEVAPNLYLGRLLSNRESREAQPDGWAGVIDLASEFAAISELRKSKSYLSIPVLDGTAPSLVQLEQAVAWLQQTLPRGPVYVHCALGRSRSAAVVIAYLLATQKVDSVEAGEALLRDIRPGVRLNSQQVEVVRQFQAKLVGEKESPPNRSRPDDRGAD